MKPFHIMAKPIGPICNLDCTYCYYLEKEKLFPKGENFKMTPEVMETYIQQYIASQNTLEVTFAWQGGEPTLLGLEYFKKIVYFQKQHSGGRKINNTLQTNGTLLDDEWCAFFQEHDFLIGLSIDGPRKPVSYTHLDVYKRQPLTKRRGEFWLRQDGANGVGTPC